MQLPQSPTWRRGAPGLAWLSHLFVIESVLILATGLSFTVGDELCQPFPNTSGLRRAVMDISSFGSFLLIFINIEVFFSPPLEMYLKCIYSFIKRH